MKLSVLLQDLKGGGAERVAVLLANALAAQGHQVELLLVRREGAYFDLLSPAVTLRDLGRKRTFSAVPTVARYLREARPDALIAHLTHVNVAATLAGLLAGQARRVFLVEHNQIRLNVQREMGAAVRLAHRAVPLVYPRAGGIIAVAEGVAEDLCAYAGFPREAVQVLHNPVVTAALEARAAEAAPHRWLEDGGPPVIVGAGRLDQQKDFGMLLRAFARLRERREARLLILGEGRERPMLEGLARELGVADEVALPGFVANPYAAFSRAACFALSSRWEGLPTVVIEALACGAPVVATDCRSGPAEILDRPGLGRLVPVGDHAAMAEALAETLEAPGDRALRLARAGDFTDERAAQAYADFIARKLA